MTNRRHFLAALPLLAAASSQVKAANLECTVYTPERQAATTPADALQRLQDGHARFLAGKTIQCDLLTQVRATSARQAPFAAVLGCIDSRVPPELVFDQRIGDIFCGRIAGNFVDVDMLGSLEFATQVEGARLVLVMGHTECGAIKGAVDGAKLGNLTATLRNLAPALAAAKVVPKAGNSKDKALVQAVADANVRITVKRMVDQSEVMRARVAAGTLMVVGAMNDISTGRVTMMS